MKIAPPLLALLLCVAQSSTALAREVGGVQMPESVQVGGKTLSLNGAGVRKKFLFSVYAAALYVEAPSRDASAVLSYDGLREIRVQVLRDLTRKQITEAIRDGFRKNAGDKMSALEARLEQLLGQLSDLKKGDSFSVIYTPGQGTKLSRGGEEITLPGKDFADALFSVWLGEKPVDGSLKKELLGL